MVKQVSYLKSEQHFLYLPDIVKDVTIKFNADTKDMERSATLFDQINKGVADQNKLLDQNASKHKEVGQAAGKAVKDTSDSFKNLDNTLGSNAQRLKELKKQLQELTPGSSKFNQLAKEAGDLQNKINDATQATRAFAKESKLSTAKTLFGALVQDIKELDFAGAASKARQLASVVNGISFAEVAGGLKNLVLTVLNLGKALLLNPFVLIATSVAAATYAVYQYTKSYEVNTKAVETNTKALAESAKALDDIQKRIDNINQGLATADLGESTKAFVKAQDVFFDGLQKIEDKSKETFDQLQKDFGLKNLVVGDTGLFDEATLENGKRISGEAAMDLNNRLIEIYEARKKEELKLEQEYQVTVEAISKANVVRQLKESEEIRAIKKKYSQGYEQELFKEASVLEETEKEKTRAIKDELEKRVEDRKEALDYVAQLEKEADALRIAREKKEADDEADKKKQQNQEVQDAIFNLTSQVVNDLYNLKTEKAALEEQQEEDRLNREIDRINKEVQAGILTEEAGAAAIFQIEATLDAQKKEFAREQFKRDRKQALFNIALDTSVAIVKSLPNYILAAAVAATGAVQAGIVLSRPEPFAKGVIDLQGGERGKDSIPAVLMPGESVMTTKETAEHKEALMAIRNDKFEDYLRKSAEPYVSMRLKEVSLANNMAQSIKLQADFPDEYALGRVMRRNKGVNVQNADYLAKTIAREIKGSGLIKHWS